MASLARDNFDVFISRNLIYDIDWKLWLNITHGLDKQNNTTPYFLWLMWFCSWKTLSYTIYTQQSNVYFVKLWFIFYAILSDYKRSLILVLLYLLHWLLWKLILIWLQFCVSATASAASNQLSSVWSINVSKRLKYGTIWLI